MTSLASPLARWQIGLLAAGLALCARSHASEGEENLPLPAWTSDSGITTASDASPLLPYDVNFIREMEGVDSLPTPLQPGLGRAGDNFLFYIPKGGKATPAPPGPTAPQIKLVDVGPDFLTKCDKQVSDDHLFDPQMVLTETHAEMLRRLLSYHREEAATIANVILMEGNQKLPQGMNLAKLAGGRLLEGHQCLVVYPMGQPLRSRLFMSHKITSVIPGTYLQEMLRACVLDALQVTDEDEQLQRFATQLSIRLIWMERAYPAVFEKPAPAASPLATESSPTPMAAVIQAPEAALSEVAPAIAAEVGPIWSTYVAWAKANWQVLAGSTGGGFALLLLSLLIKKTSRRKRRQTVWILPEAAAYEPRLGGPHCGGGGAGIKFG